MCEVCDSDVFRRLKISKGTIKQLQWMENSDLDKAARIRFSQQSTMECLGFLEAFVSYHIERKLKSLTFLKQMRQV